MKNRDPLFYVELANIFTCSIKEIVTDPFKYTGRCPPCHHLVLLLRAAKFGKQKKANLLSSLIGRSVSVPESDEVFNNVASERKRHYKYNGPTVLEHFLKSDTLLKSTDVVVDNDQTPPAAKTKIKKRIAVTQPKQPSEGARRTFRYKTKVVIHRRVITSRSTDSDRRHIDRLKRTIADLKSRVSELEAEAESWKVKTEATHATLESLKESYRKLDEENKNAEHELSLLSTSDLDRKEIEELFCVSPAQPTSTSVTQTDVPIPKIPVRESLKKISPKLTMTIGALMNRHKLSYGNSLEVFACVSNTFFNQDYRLGKSATVTKRNRDIIPKCVSTSSSSQAESGSIQEPNNSKKRKICVDSQTMPSKTWVKEQQKEIHLPLSLLSIAEEVKNSCNSTGHVDGFSDRRDKGTVAGLMVLNKERTKTNYYPIGCDQSSGSDSSSTAEWIKMKLQYLATISANGATADDILQSTRELTAKVKFWITDDGPQMRPAIEQLSQWKREIGVVVDTVWGHCNAHIEPALASNLTKVLLKIEKALDVRKFVVENYNEGFFGGNASCVTTMVFALMNLLGPSSKNQEWSLTKKFGQFLKINGEKRNHLQDAHSSRFGKNSEFMVLIAYHFNSIKSFMSGLYETNKMFMSCQRYVGCPYFREICVAVGLLYYHVVRPFLVGVGTETYEGYKMLTHVELCDFYPALIETLQKLASEEISCQCLLLPEALQFLADYPTLIEVSHKGHKAIYGSLFSEIASESCEMSTTVITKTCALIAAGYAGTFTEQAEVYLTGGTLKKMLDADPSAMDGVPVNALGAEHQVAQYRHKAKTARTASIMTIGLPQIIAPSPYMARIQNYSNDELLQMFKFARRDPRAKKAKELMVVSQQVAEEHARKELADAQNKRIKQLGKKKDALKKCKDNHGGPITSPADLATVLKKKADVEEKFKVLQLEIFYMRDVIYESCIMTDKSIFVAKKKDEFGKMNPKPISELKKNFLQLLSPDFASSSTPEAPSENELAQKLDCMRTEMVISNSVKKVLKTVGTYLNGEYVAVYWQEEDLSNVYYIGRISRVIPASKCRACKTAGFARLNKDRSDPCYEIVYLTQKGARYEFVDTQEYHTVAATVLCKVTVLPSGRKHLVLTYPEPAVLDAFVLNNSVCKAASVSSE